LRINHQEKHEGVIVNLRSEICEKNGVCHKGWQVLGYTSSKRRRRWRSTLKAAKSLAKDLCEAVGEEDSAADAAWAKGEHHRPAVRKTWAEMSKNRLMPKRVRLFRESAKQPQRLRRANLRVPSASRLDY
jgi:hypothetical protein